MDANTSGTSPVPTSSPRVEDWVATNPKLKKTSGEKFYDVMQFLVGKVFILAVTAALAFTAHASYGPDKVLGVPNYLKRFQIYLQDKLIPKDKAGSHAELLGFATSTTIILGWGGTFFAPVIKWLENSKETIANAWNKRFGTPEEVEIAHQRLKDEPKQDWWDVLKGRGAAYLTVFSSVLSAYVIGHKNKNYTAYDNGVARRDADGNTVNEWRMNLYEDKFGRAFSGFMAKLGWDKTTGEAISKTPLSKPLEAEHSKNKTYRFGKVLAIDLFATSVALILWNVFSRNSAKKRVEKEAAEQKMNHPAETTAPILKAEEAVVTGSVKNTEYGSKEKMAKTTVAHEVKERPLTQDELQHEYRTLRTYEHEENGKQWTAGTPEKESPKARDESHAEQRRQEKAQVPAEVAAGI